MKRDPRPVIWAALIALAAGLAAPTTALAAWQGGPERQVVIFGVEAVPGRTTMDPKISPVVAAQLRRALPNHGFRLIAIKSERALAGQTVNCSLGAGFVSSAQLLNPLDVNGRVQIRYELSQFGASMFQSIVTSPADQFNFFDKMQPDNSHLLVGVGAR